ncbi:MAG TPA: hypothetical protein VGF54_15490 [Streptosporangiaceae bacterium]|jgi:uncharacterized membrane protein
MADLIAIGYPDETTAEAAAGQARQLAHNLIIQPGAVAVIVRDKQGRHHVRPSHYPVGAVAARGMFTRMKPAVRQLPAQWRPRSHKQSSIS